MKKSIFIISFIFLFASCATTHMTIIDKAPDLPTDPNKATLVIIHDTYFGGAIVFWNYLDRYMEYNPQSGGKDMDSNLYRQAIDEYQRDVKENPDAYKDIFVYDGVVIY